MTILENLAWRRRWCAHMGAIKGCLEYLGSDISYPWLYGGTAHALVMNTAPDRLEAGPTFWRPTFIPALAPNLGFRLQGIFAGKKRDGSADYPERQREAWDLVRAAIDRGLPCIGWELHPFNPDWYVIYGYDEVGYYYSGWESSDQHGPLPWQRLGDMEVRFISVWAVSLCEPQPPQEIVRAAIKVALRHAYDPGEWLYPGFIAGPAGLAHWAETLATGTALRQASSYVALFWSECRGEAVPFLEDAAAYVPRTAAAHLRQAAADYAVTRTALGALAVLHPMDVSGDWEERFRSPDAAALIRQAEAAERDALRQLEQALNA